MHEKIINNQEIIKLYQDISEYEEMTGGWAHHDFNHVSNVAKMVEKILEQLQYDRQFIEEAKIAAILHDMGSLQGKENHANRSYELAQNYFERKAIKMKNEELVLEAIRIHSDGFETDNIMALALILADKLDIKKTRLARAGYGVEGLNEIQHIEEIQVTIDSEQLVITFVANEDMDLLKLESFYFIPKVFKSIRNFSKKLNLQPCVLLNNQPWNLNLDEIK